MCRFYNLSHKSYTITFLWHLPSVVIHSSSSGEGADFWVGCTHKTLHCPCWL